MVVDMILVVGSVLIVAGWGLAGVINRNTQAIEDLKQLIVKQERDRMHAKCSGLFARLFRALSPDVVFTYRRVEFNVMELDFNGALISVAVREHMGPFETGQFVAFLNNYPTIHSCEEDMKAFGRQIVQAVKSISTCNVT